MAVDGLHVDRVVAGPRAEVGRTAVGRDDSEGVIARAQRDVKHFEVAVDDPAGQDAAGDHSVAGHAQAVERRRGEHTHVGGRAAGVGHVQGIDLHRFVDAGIQIDRPVEVLVACRGLVEFARLDDRHLAHRRDFDARGKGGVVEVCDDEPVAAGGRAERRHRTGDDALRQFARHVGQRVARLDHIGVRGSEGGVVEDHRPHLAFEEGGRVERDAGSPGLGRGRCQVGHAERGTGAVDHVEGRAVGQRGEAVRRVDVDRRGQRGDHAGSGVGRAGGDAVLGAGIAHPDERDVGHVLRQRPRPAQRGRGGGADQADGGRGEAQVVGLADDREGHSGRRAAARPEDDQRAVLGGRGEGGVGGADLCGQSGGDVGRRFAGHHDVLVVDAAQAGAPDLDGHRRAGQLRRPGARRGGRRYQRDIAAGGRRIEIALVGRRDRHHGDKAAGDGCRRDQHQALAFCRGDIAAACVDQSRQRLGHIAHAVVALRVVVVGTRATARRCQCEGPFLAGHRVAGQFYGCRAAHGLRHFEEFDRGVNRRDKAETGGKRRKGIAAVDDHDRLARGDRMEAGQTRGGVVEARGEDARQCFPAVSDERQAIHLIGLADRDADAIRQVRQQRADGETPYLARLRRAGEGDRGRALRVGRDRRRGRRRGRHDAERRLPDAAVARDDDQLPSLGHRGQRCRAGGVDKLREGLCDVGLPLGHGRAQPGIDRQG